MLPSSDQGIVLPLCIYAMATQAMSPNLISKVHRP